MNRNSCNSEFLKGYLDAALFTTDEHPPGGRDYVESGRSDEMFPSLPRYFVDEAARDCERFQSEQSALLAQAGSDWQNGADFWFTRNGHGVGFWDRDYNDAIGDGLTRAAHAFGEHYLCSDEIGQAA